jgi:trans-2,3-dihydro-3-hydroxyanthranilate isomerase
LKDGGERYARMCAPALGIDEDPATGSASAALVGAVASRIDLGKEDLQLSIQQGVAMGRQSKIAPMAHRRGRTVTSISIGGATTFVAAGEIDVPAAMLTT